MKKLFSLFILMAFVFTLAKAQTVTMIQSGDTVINTAQKACSLKVAQSHKQVSIQALITKISGTVGGVVTLQGSLDNGVTWSTVDSSSFVTHSPATLANYTATNVNTQVKTWILNYSPYLWYKLIYTGTGTMSATLKGYVLARD